MGKTAIGRAARGRSADRRYAERCAVARERWALLPLPRRLQLLRFEDPALVSLAFASQQNLYAADFECLMLGVTGQDQVRIAAGVEFFDVEGRLDRGGELQPKALVAKTALAEREDLVDFVHKRARDGINGSLSITPRADWLSLLEPPPSSWDDFGRSLFRLVLVALLEEPVKDSHPEPPQTIHSEVGEVLEDTTSKSSKRRARRKRVLAASASTGPLDQFVDAVDVDELDSVAPHDSAASRQFEPDSYVGKTELVHDVASTSANDVDGLVQRRRPSSWPAEEGSLRRVSAVSHSVGEERQSWSLVQGAFGSSARSSLANVVEMEETLAENQASRRSADGARVSAAVQPVLTASQASRASAREARLRAEVTAREARRSAWPPWLLARRRSPQRPLEKLQGQAFADAAAKLGGMAIVRNTFVEIVPVTIDQEPSGQLSDWFSVAQTV